MGWSGKLRQYLEYAKKTFLRRRRNGGLRDDDDSVATRSVTFTHMDDDDTRTIMSDSSTETITPTLRTPVDKLWKGQQPQKPKGSMDYSYGYGYSSQTNNPFASAQDGDMTRGRASGESSRQATGDSLTNPSITPGPSGERGNKKESPAASYADQIRRKSCTSNSWSGVLFADCYALYS